MRLVDLDKKQQLLITGFKIRRQIVIAICVEENNMPVKNNNIIQCDKYQI